MGVKLCLSHTKKKPQTKNDKRKLTDGHIWTRRYDVAEICRKIRNDKYS